ncbi:probable G-protein coupled receptor 63 [Paramacrobiotus metropolitanus]|uniref:probable G-protein coupled receptor 63 n=1 Tax=Paramacrobiotus metropolitanus TaxID=2943436 RepID=UPI0024457267|nr:probable G-protein coupled receptor 63 [Paramacrobiotus metropolitanus]
MAANLSSNETAARGLNAAYFTWSMLADFNPAQITTTTICMLTILLNGFLLVIFILERPLRTSFAVYLIVLAAGNIVNAWFQNPLTLAIKDRFAAPQLTVFCAVNFFLRQTAVAFVPLVHLFIGLNRLWALLQPHSYRLRHTCRLAVAVCGATGACIVLYLAPPIILDAFHTHKPFHTFFCVLNLAYPGYVDWTLAFNVIFLVVPEVLIVLLCPLLLVHRTGFRHRVQASKAPPTDSASKSAGTGDPDAEKRVKRKNSLRVLILLTVSVIICWTPLNVYYFFPSLVDNPVFYRTGNMLKILHSMLDPLLFIASLDDLRRACVDRLRCRA